MRVSINTRLKKELTEDRGAEPELRLVRSSPILRGYHSKLKKPDLKEIAYMYKLRTARDLICYVQKLVQSLGTTCVLRSTSCWHTLKKVRVKYFIGLSGAFTHPLQIHLHFLTF